VLKTFGGIFDYDTKSRRLIELNLQLEDSKIWDDPKLAQALGKEKKMLDGVVNSIQKLDGDLSGAIELFDLAAVENDADTLEAIATD
jgi:peptide chain release factor 2